MPNRRRRRLEGVESPRLKEFARACTGAGRARLRREWTMLRGDGFPLIETASTAPTKCLVSFVWRPTRKVSSPSLYSPVVDLLHGEAPLKPLGTTGAWYRTLLLPRRTRAHYAFSPRPFPGMDADGSAWGRYFHELEPDPNNPSRLRIPYLVSVVSLPDAPPQPWGVQHGPSLWRTVRHRLRSRSLNNSRRITVFLPSGWQGGNRDHNLFIVLDGEAYRRVVPAPVVVENLVRSGRIAPSVLVLVDNASGARERELTYNPKFVEFLTDDLLPWLRDAHHVSLDGARTLLAGSSLGGLTAAFAALRSPGRFGNVLAQSGAFQALQWDRPRSEPSTPTLMEEFARGPRQPIRFYLDAGTFEGMAFPGMQMSLLAGVRHFRDVLVAKGYSVAYAEFEGGHDYACWAGTFADGILALFGDRVP
jgi:enterochelin esterase-like enzyme